MKIEFQYKSFFRTKKYEIEIADRWNDLPANFVSNNCDVLSRIRNIKYEELSEIDRIRLIIGLLNIPKKIQKKIDIDFLKTNTADNNSLWNIPAFLFNNDQVDVFWIEKIKTRNNYIYCPEHKLAYMTFGEFVFTDTYYMAYCQTNDPAYAKKMICSLYRELSDIEPLSINYKGKLVEFNDKSVDYRANSIVISQNEIDAIVFNYSLIRQTIISDSEISGLFVGDENSNTTPDIEAWLKVAKNLRKSFESDDCLMKLNYKYVLSDILKEINKKGTKE